MHEVKYVRGHYMQLNKKAMIRMKWNQDGMKTNDNA